jgi:shikimate kinase
MKNIILIGMCGAGKTTLAKEVANKINYNSIDADEVIEKNRGETFQEFMFDI